MCPEQCCLPCTQKKSDHTTSLLKSLHWLPVHLRIHYKILSLCYKSLNNSAPIYLSNSLHIYTPSRSLRSASDSLCLHIPRTKLSTFAPHSFSSYGPSTWNTLPHPLHLKLSFSSFQSALKIHLFQPFQHFLFLFTYTSPLLTYPSGCQTSLVCGWRTLANVRVCCSCICSCLIACVSAKCALRVITIYKISTL